MASSPRVPRAGIVLTVLAVGAASLAVRAQTTALRDSLIAQTLRANPQLIAMQFDARAARSKMRQASAWDDPQIAIELYNTPASSLNPIRDGRETDYSITQMFPFPGKKSRMQDAAGAGAGAMDAGVEERRRRLIGDVKRAYVELYSAQQRLLVNDSLTTTLEQLLDITNAQTAVGRATTADVLKLRLEMAKLQNARALLIHDAHVPEAMLNSLRDAEMDTLGQLPEPPVVEFDFDVHALVDTAFEHRWALKQATMEVTMAKAELSAQERERMPDLMVRGMYKHMVEEPDAYALMFGINVPVAPWSSGKYDAREEELQLRVKAMESMRHDRENMVEFEVHDAWVKARAHWEEFSRLNHVIIPVAMQTYAASLAAFQNGQGDFFSVFDSFRMLWMYRMDLYESFATYAMHIADLEQATGITLDGGVQ